jgi:hypothetical protein
MGFLVPGANRYRWGVASPPRSEVSIMYGFGSGRRVPRCSQRHQDTSGVVGNMRGPRDQGVVTLAVA